MEDVPVRQPWHSVQEVEWAAGKWREGQGGGGRQRERNCSSLYLCSSIYIAILTNGGENSIIVDPTSPLQRQDSVLNINAQGILITHYIHPLFTRSAVIIFAVKKKKKKKKKKRRRQ